MPHYKYLHRQTVIRDALWLSAINVLLFIIYAKYDFFEWVLDQVEQYEYLELDEILPLTASLTISLLIFTYRRMVELGKISQAFENLAKYDPLTNTLNRRAGYILLQQFNDSAINKNESYSLLQLDLDDFKRINDLYGSSIGDEVLINLANLIKQQVPSDAEIIHWHSDNFIIAMPSTKQAPFELANTLRYAIEEKLFAADKITCSIGLTMWQSGTSLADMLLNVEDALLDAKAANKNTVKVA
ncbi:GGDEF domain-containing protein [Colwellia sp. D2M02]|uniref:GGDEF domain-containing protein n=1 Tax=Colwellia sp. D2M02 TaxID=2841562 RepID=UPI001C09D6F3|nr:GGDEF domain-containing protein [Colwellia sp. D2M02]MBU2893522.1 GGDEF domain-containing protein [Colwellia sp. D2M02]